ncbi:MAG: serine protease [Candidatus Rokubacteria bacterium]|nr:serine protease [Candidatus Rokubacteria bacterium]
MGRRLSAAVVVLALVPALGGAAPVVKEPRIHPGTVPAEPSYVRRVEPALVGLQVRADEHAPSSARLGSRRFGSGVIFDARGYAVTVSYVLMDAVGIEARLRDGRRVPARLVGLDLETGLGVVQLVGPGPWPVGAFGPAGDVAEGTPTGTVGVDEDNDLVYVTGRVQAVRRFAGPWEYMLDRALIVAPGSPAWSGSAVVDTDGRVIGIASLRLGAPPHVNLAIPADRLGPVKDELIAAGRVVSRRPRPWLGLYTTGGDTGLLVDGFSPAGPAAAAGFRRGDRIVGVNDVRVGSQEEFYDQLWRGQAGDVVRVAVERNETVHVIAVRSVNRYDTLRRPAGSEP